MIYRLPFSCTDKSVLQVLRFHENWDTGLCNPKISTVANELSLGESTVRGSLKRLEGFGVITVSRDQRKSGDSGRQTTNRYLIHWLKISHYKQVSPPESEALSICSPQIMNPRPSESGPLRGPDSAPQEQYSLFNSKEEQVSPPESEALSICSPQQLYPSNGKVLGGDGSSLGRDAKLYPEFDPDCISILEEINEIVRSVKPNAPPMSMNSNRGREIVEALEASRSLASFTGKEPRHIVIEVWRWFMQSDHDRAAWLRENNFKFNTIMSPGKFIEYAEIANSDDGWPGRNVGHAKKNKRITQLYADQGLKMRCG